MLDRDPNADRPPDPPLLRTRSRSHRQKNAPKKQPQRGLGVAQLEKLRLEEQSKQQEALCFASVHHQNLHPHNQFVQLQQDRQASYVLYPHQNFQHQHNQGPHPSPLFLPRHFQRMENSYEKASFTDPRFRLPCVKLNALQNDLLPLASVTSQAQTRPVPLFIPQWQFPAEHEASTSPVSQAHDLCSPATQLRPSSAESRLCPLLKGASPASLVDKSWLNHLYDRDSDKEKDSLIISLSSACSNDIDVTIQCQDCSATPGVNTGNANFHELSGLHRLDLTMFIFLQEPIKNLPCLMLQLGFTSDGFQTKELSSFQNIFLCPTWSPVDKELNRKRSWACAQQLARSSGTFKGIVDLNVSADEVESEMTEQDPNVSLPFSIRDDWNLLCDTSIGKSSESGCVGQLSDKAVSNLNSVKVGKHPADPCLNGPAFVSLCKQKINFEKWEVKNCGDFLTLGPSSSALEKLMNVHSGLENYSNHPISKNFDENECFEHSLCTPLQQVRNSCISSLSEANNELPLKYEPSFLHALQKKVEFSDFFASKTSEPLLQERSTNDSLDLELRLSI
ncbi:hypothetical protein KP509_23G076500 [Ceratopteris richardii]|uniref:Uncharacterized protein n=1 Tax=Ceratopteris richardii TaxID=49495 RepID=A0A8T2S1A1_CERRI|nr:hypothetical protein KP509_23G076500 [Ceratopteris richardii]